MGRWTYTWEVCYYGEGCFINRKIVEAKTKEEAIRKVREKNKIIEMIRVRRIDKWY